MIIDGTQSFRSASRTNAIKMMFTRTCSFQKGKLLYISILMYQWLILRPLQVSGNGKCTCNYPRSLCIRRTWSIQSGPLHSHFRRRGWRAFACKPIWLWKKVYPLAFAFSTFYRIMLTNSVTESVQVNTLARQVSGYQLPVCLRLSGSQKNWIKMGMRLHPHLGWLPA